MLAKQTPNKAHTGTAETSLNKLLIAALVVGIVNIVALSFFTMYFHQP